MPQDGSRSERENRCEIADPTDREMLNLTILSIAYPFSSVSVDSVGGAEQVLAAVDEAIVRAGHRSIVIAREGSRISGELVPVPAEPGILDGGAVARAHAAVVRATARVLAERHVDVVHMHGIDFDRYLPAPGPPVLVTLHLPPSWYPREALMPARPRTHLCCVSHAQRAALPAWAASAEVIENGVPVDGFHPIAAKEDYCLVLARICPEKGIEDALEAADRARLPVVLAGEVSAWEAHRRYFDEVISPRLAPPHRWVGPVGFDRKRALLAAVRALLVPSKAPETSSLVAMEALASGTPVVAYAAGALPEVIEHGRTGFIVDDAHAMARAIGLCAQISPHACRQAAVTRFSARAMTTQYLAAYERLAGRRHAPGRGTASRALVLEEARGVEALAALTQEWSALWRRCPTASPFQSPEWLLAYARTFCGASAEPWALVARIDGKLAALAPLCTRGQATTLLGDGVSDYLDIVVDPDLAARCTATILDALRLRCRDGSSVVLDELRASSPLVTFADRDGGADDTFQRGPCPAIRLMAGIDPLPRAMRDNVRYYRRRAERLGAVEVDEATGPAAADWLETLLVLHRARWRARGEEGVLASPDVQAFQRDAVAALSAAGIARVYGLRVGGRRCAAMLVLRDAWAAYHYIGGFDPEVRAISPGTILIAHAIDRAREEGLAEFDFLRGAEPYKYRFGARDRFNWGRRLATSRVAA
jgi:CelD/BcsL family acetyltransferase involved in cellulose biosynthesis/glycosyltransferase involved in cell wall biosynthesis